MNTISFAQKAFILHDGKLLLVRKSPEDRNHPERWEVPGGRLHFGEDLDDHLKREVWEEVGIEVKLGSPFFVWQWIVESDQQKTQVVAIARICAPSTFVVSDLNRVEDDCLDQIAWVPLSEVGGYNLIPNMIPCVQRFFELCTCDRVRKWASS